MKQLQQLNPDIQKAIEDVQAGSEQMKHERDLLREQYKKLREECNTIDKHRASEYQTNQNMLKQQVRLYGEINEVKRERDELRKLK